MYICLCNNINETQIRQAAAQGANSLADLRDGLGVASQCGQCACMAEAVLECEQQRLGSVPSWRAHNWVVVWDQRLCCQLTGGGPYP